MDLGLAGKRALVTGSSTGIGAACARQLAREGARVVVHGRDARRVAQMVEEIRAEGGVADGCPAELDPAGAEAFLDRVADLVGGPPQVLVNNAGAYDYFREWDTLTAEDWLETFNLNLFAAVELTRLSAVGMIADGWGRIIHIGSVEAFRPGGAYPDYGASKAALGNFTASLAREVGGCGVTSNMVTPGVILTSGVDPILTALADRHGWGEDRAEIERRAYAEIASCPVGRFGRVEDVAPVVTWLASEQAAFVTGSNWRVDGGLQSQVG